MKRILAPLALVAAVFMTGAFICRAALAGSSAPAPSYAGEAVVRWVIDGDTIVLESGSKVRYTGIDTPEAGEPLYEEARQRNISLVRGKSVTVAACREEPFDKYGRLLARVYADGADVSETLLAEGLARTLVIPPCGLKKARRYRALEKEARAKGLGLWRHDAVPMRK